MIQQRRLWLTLVLTTVVAASNAAAQGPTVSLDPAISCWANDGFPIASAKTEPVGDIETARLFFRCSTYPDFYYVDLALTDGQFESALPQADAACPSVIYYVEVVDENFNVTRTEEIEATVGSSSACKKNRYFAGIPVLTVGSLSGLTTLPPGFSAVGIGSVIASTGAAGGITAGTIAIASGAAAGTAGAVAATTGGGSTSTTTTTTTIAGSSPSPSTTTTAPPTGTSTTTTTAPPFNEPPRACFESDPVSMTVRAGEPIQLDANCSKPDRTGTGTGDTITNYEWDMGDGRMKTGRLITTVYATPGTYTVELTVTDAGGASGVIEQDQTSGQIEVLPNIEACFQFTPVGDMCDVSFNASCSLGSIVQYDWFFEGNPPFLPNSNSTTSTATTSHSWGSDPECFEAPSLVRSVTLTVRDGSGASDTITKDITIPGGMAQQRTQPSELASLLSVETGRAQGQVSVDESSVVGVSAGAWQRHSFDSHDRTHRVAATLTSAGGQSGRWEFDLSGTEGFTPSSLRAESGEILVIEATRIVFRLRGEPGERVSFTFRTGTARSSPRR